MPLQVFQRKHLLGAGCSSLLLMASLSASASVTAQPPASLSRDDIAWLRRATFGLDSASIARYRQLGRQRYLDDELRGRDDTLPPAVSAMLNSYTVINTPPAQLQLEYRAQRKQFKDAPQGAAKDAARKSLQQERQLLSRQDMQVALLHAIYGGDQLKEQVVWFWLNHFSIHAAKGSVRLHAARYEENVIRPYALGKFRDLVMATLLSPAMLEYLDNAHNIKGKTNENYARELMELQTLGVGSGYTQQDVQQLMHMLTGAGILPPRMAERLASGRRPDRPGFVRHGDFLFNPRHHDYGNRVFLGHTIKGRGFAEIEQAVDLIVQQPACAHFISRQLAEYFVADQPPAALVDAMAQTFQHTDGDIAAVLRSMFLSPLLRASYGHKFKDPTQFLVSAVRLSWDGRVVANPAPLVNWLRQMGELPFGRITPDGWPLDAASWDGSGQMAKRFEVAREIASGRNKLFAAAGEPRRPAPPTLQNAIYQQTIKPTLSSATRKALQKAASPIEWNTFLLSSPDFNYR